jgi:hypothetical protein
MGFQATLDSELLERLQELVQYAIDRFNYIGQGPSAEYLEEQLHEIQNKIKNERYGGGDTTCVQIDTMIRLLGEDDG